MDVATVAADLDATLAGLGTPERAEHEKRYLRSELVHYGVSVPEIRAAAKSVRRTHPDATHDELVALVVDLWARTVHECRVAAVELLVCGIGLLDADDLDLVERLLREARTWAIVDGLSANVAGVLVERDPAGAARWLDRWSVDEDFWLRRASLLALLPALRRGAGDFDRFSRYADAMLDEREFFIRKAIGWVLRDTGRHRPDVVAAHRKRTVRSDAS